MNLYPLKGLPQQKQLWSWISYDVANQSFTLIVNTLLFSVFFTDVVVTSKGNENQLWSITFGASMLLAALASPIAGAAADERAWKKEGLIVTGFICAIFTCLLALIQPGQVWLAMLLYIPANFAFSVGENFLASFLPSLARQDQVGRVSGFSWGCAYAAALFLLCVTAAAIVGFGLKDQPRPFFVFAGVWFLAFMIPVMLWLKEPELNRPEHPGKNLLTVGFVRLGETLRHLKGYRDLATLLLASLFYGTGMSVVVFFASNLAKEYGFKDVERVIFLAVITVSGIIGTIIPMLFQDRVGHRRSTVVLLVVWILAAVSFAFYAYRHEVFVAAGGDPEGFIKWPLWVIGNLLGFGLGSLGSANRAFVGYLAPPDRAAEVFGLWGMMFKLAAIMTFPFAYARDKLGTPQALVLLAGFLIVGLILTFLVNEKRGHAAAQSGVL
ncbi:MFS transporter [Luteolibacter luteus]|uniref:MFS transporter n=1 Tax=Luteolibacter luteus TaxID=2728835 RepID=A0A858RN53_9BACT|nr:MFS transporter [Luteolibacter luteus]QJE98437.1 MFS transporter [Luteolibacter luteus]